MIPLIDIRRQHQSLKGEMERAIGEVMDQGRFVLGKTVKPLKRRWPPFAEPDTESG